MLIQRNIHATKMEAMGIAWAAERQWKSLRGVLEVVGTVGFDDCVPL